MSKACLIIGASSDLGIELIKKIVSKEEDMIIYAHYRTSKNTIDSIDVEKGNKIIPIQADLAEDSGVKVILQKLEEDNVVPNAIVHLPAPKLEFIKFKDIKWEDCINDLNIQVGSVFKLLQKLLPKMIKNEGQSKVVFVLSENTIKLPAKFSTKYSMSKYMLLGLMKSLVAEYDGKSININALSPTMMDTKLLSDIDRRLLEMTGAIDNMVSTTRVASELYKLVTSDSDLMNGENILITSDKRGMDDE